LDRWSKNVNLDIIQQIKDYGQDAEKHYAEAASPYQFKTS